MEASSNSRELENSIITNPIINENKIIISQEDMCKLCQAAGPKDFPTALSEFLENLKSLEGWLEYSSTQVQLANSYKVIDFITDLIKVGMAAQLGDIAAGAASKATIALLAPKLIRYFNEVKSLTTSNFEFNSSDFTIDDLLKIIFTIAFDKRAEKVKEKVFSSAKGWNLNSVAQLVSGGKIDINGMMRSKVEMASEFLFAVCNNQAVASTMFGATFNLPIDLKERLERLEKIKNYLTQPGIQLNENGEKLSNYIPIAMQAIEAYKEQNASEEVKTVDPLVAYDKIEDEEKDSGISSDEETKADDTSSNKSINISDNSDNAGEDTQELNNESSARLVGEKKEEDDEFFDAVSQFSSSSTEDEELSSSEDEGEFYDTVEILTPLDSVSRSSSLEASVNRADEAVDKVMTSSSKNSDPSLTAHNKASLMGGSASIDNSDINSNNNIDTNELSITTTDTSSSSQDQANILDTDGLKNTVNNSSVSAALPLLNSAKNLGKEEGIMDRFSHWLNKGESEGLNKCHISVSTGSVALMTVFIILCMLIGVIVTIALRRHIFEASQNLVPTVITKVPGWAAAPVNFVLNYPTTTICLAAVLVSAMMLAITTVLINRDEKNSEVRTRLEETSVFNHAVAINR